MAVDVDRSNRREGTDIPMYRHMFGYVAPGALLNWAGRSNVMMRMGDVRAMSNITRSHLSTVALPSFRKLRRHMTPSLHAHAKHRGGNSARTRTNSAIAPNLSCP